MLITRTFVPFLPKSDVKESFREKGQNVINFGKLLNFGEVLPKSKKIRRKFETISRKSGEICVESQKICNTSPKISASIRKKDHRNFRKILERFQKLL